ncbi:uncharacterized protein LOC126901290 [Daktulosphaira vitifoliae]|uniref:uncharacterized protein LOC126901290 n=1 Tax=Daktulosphaira vitifoliae TaxID=58002 RepID=UPI0021AA8D12|nr:uncharacterized protein LOC126901290 [Daktulosphaira vitifoliae]
MLAIGLLSVLLTMISCIIHLDFFGIFPTKSNYSSVEQFRFSDYDIWVPKPGTETPIIKPWQSYNQDNIISIGKASRNKPIYDYVYKGCTIINLTCIEPNRKSSLYDDYEHTEIEDISDYNDVTYDDLDINVQDISDDYY